MPDGSLPVDLAELGDCLVVLRFAEPQTRAHSAAAVMNPDMQSQLPDEAARERMCTDDERLCRAAAAQCRARNTPVLVIDLRGSTFVNTLRLGNMLRAREGVVERGGRCVALVDDAQGGAAKVLRLCGFDRMMVIRVR